jgi:hypothetical protein
LTRHFSWATLPRHFPITNSPKFFFVAAPHWLIRTVAYDGTCDSNKEKKKNILALKGITPWIVESLMRDEEITFGADRAWMYIATCNQL